jgi:hypothetical protein
MGNHRMEPRKLQVNTSSLIMSKAIVVETRRQPTRVIITKSLEVGVTTKGVENNCCAHHGCCQKGSTN